MIAIFQFLIKTWVRPFYVINAGFFLFAFFFFFGMVNGSQLISYHLSLMQSMLQSPVMLAVVCVGWLWYAIKCLNFCGNSITAADSNYIFALKALPALRQWLLFAGIAICLYLPVLAYVLVLLKVALQQHYYIPATQLVLVQVILLGLIMAGIFFSINQNNRHLLAAKLWQGLSRFTNIRIGLYGFLLAFVLQQRKQSFAMVKIFSLLLLSVSLVRNADNFDEDLFGILFQLVLVTHAVLVFYLFEFWENYFSFSRNLPLAAVKAALLYVFTYMVLLLPEAGFMLINNQGNLPVASMLFLYGIAIAMLFLYTAILYATGGNISRYTNLLLAGFIMIFFVLKTGYLLGSMLGIAGIAALIFLAHYYSYEKEPVKD
jgi:hypothetical protein